MLSENNILLACKWCSSSDIGAEHIQHGTWLKVGDCLNVCQMLGYWAIMSYEWYIGNFAKMCSSQNKGRFTVSARTSNNWNNDVGFTVEPTSCGAEAVTHPTITLSLSFELLTTRWYVMVCPSKILHSQELTGDSFSADCSLEAVVNEILSKWLMHSLWWLNNRQGQSMSHHNATDAPTMICLSQGIRNYGYILADV